MTNTFVIKIGDWFYNKHTLTGGCLSRNLGYATEFAHPDVAQQEIIDEKLENAEVYQVNYVFNRVSGVK